MSSKLVRLLSWDIEFSMKLALFEPKCIVPNCIATWNILFLLSSVADYGCAIEKDIL